LGRDHWRSMAREKKGAASMLRRHERRRRRRSTDALREEEGWVGRKVEQASWLLGRLGQKLKENSFWNKNWIFQYTKALEIWRRFMRNFDMGLFS
jgi:hypothetical protein